MLKRIITFEDFDGNKVTEAFYFHLSTPELIRQEMGEDGGLRNKLKKILQSGDKATIFSTFEDLIGMTVGKRSEDGKSFIKTPEIRDAFMGSNAYTELFMSLITDANAAAEFVRGVMPADISKKLPQNLSEESMRELLAEKSEPASDGLPEVMARSPESYGHDEIVNMPQEQFDELFGKDPRKWDRKVMMAAYQRKTKTQVK